MLGSREIPPYIYFIEGKSPSSVNLLPQTSITAKLRTPNIIILRNGGIASNNCPVNQSLHLFQRMVINRSTVSGLELAEIINASFNKVNADMQPLLFGGIPVQLTPDEFIISPDAVETSLLAINERKSTGPDNTELVTQGMHLRDLQSSSFYLSTKERYQLCADVVPIAKISKPMSPDSDLRPISLTTTLSKVLLDFVFGWLRLISMPQLDTRQFGGIKNSSTTHALVRVIH